MTTLALSQLDGREATLLVKRLIGNAGLSREAVNEIVERSDGVPLFVEELAKAVLESVDRDDPVAGQRALMVTFRSRRPCMPR